MEKIQINEVVVVEDFVSNQKESDIKIPYKKNERMVLNDYHVEVYDKFYLLNIVGLGLTFVEKKYVEIYIDEINKL